MELLSVLRTGVAESLTMLAAESLTMLAAVSTACTWTGQVSIWIKCNADVGGIQTCLVCQILTLVVSVQNNSIFQLILHNKTLWYFIKYEYICIYQMISIYLCIYICCETIVKRWFAVIKNEILSSVQISMCSCYHDFT